MDSTEFRKLLNEGWSTLSVDQAEKIVRFRDLVVDESERQNLTKLISPRDFFDGHVLDAKNLLESGLLDYPAMDLGSGVGVPGIIAGLVDEKFWVLAESEGHKAAFLTRVCQELGLDKVSAFSGRGEKYLEKKTIGSIVARAVGPVGRIFTWIRDCSTWNNLVLLKGPGWELEWAEFQKTSAGKKLRIAHTHEYSVGAESKRRVIIRLERVTNVIVPRGT